LISRKWSNCFPNSLTDDDFPTCRAPRSSNGLREAARPHSAKWLSISLLRYFPLMFPKCFYKSTKKSDQTYNIFQKKSDRTGAVFRKKSNQTICRKSFLTKINNLKNFGIEISATKVAEISITNLLT